MAQADHREAADGRAGSADRQPSPSPRLGGYVGGDHVDTVGGSPARRLRDDLATGSLRLGRDRQQPGALKRDDAKKPPDSSGCPTRPPLASDWLPPLQSAGLGAPASRT